jgi:uncharacterized protein with NRDE domain
VCTVIILYRVHPRFPVVIAANRDELYARRTAPPRLLAEAPRVIGGLDRERGGTWMGATAGGLIVGITNQRSWGGARPDARSRGEVVLEALRAGSPEAVTDMLERLDPAAYNPFNLLYGDAGGLRVAYAREGGVAIEPVPEGIRILPNDRLDSPDFAKVSRARALAELAAHRPWPDLVAPLQLALADHERPPLDQVTEPPPGSPVTRELARELQALCIHTPSYGTRSSTLVALEPGRTAHYLHADGPPCRTELADVTALLG